MSFQKILFKGTNHTNYLKVGFRRSHCYLLRLAPMVEPLLWLIIN